MISLYNLFKQEFAKYGIEEENRQNPFGKLRLAELKTEAIDIEQLADLIVGKMKVAEPQKHKEPIKESAWDSFFNGGK